ncbi:MAG: hypothetical protein JSR99_13650 [Proteobacteria bacterium]|nr:hypothetical protein [Pseudomonadota bacterium]
MQLAPLLPTWMRLVEMVVMLAWPVMVAPPVTMSDPSVPRPLLLSVPKLPAPVAVMLVVEILGALSRPAL